MEEYKPPSKFKAIFVRVLGLYIAVGFLLWLDILIPTTRTHFKNYQAYLDSRRVGENYGSSYFEEELPTSAEDMKYYSRYMIVANITAYSMTLDADTYEEVKNNRIDLYVKESKEPPCSPLYEAQEDERWYLDGSEWYRKKLGYVDMVLHHPEARQQYYFGAAMQDVDFGSRVSYNGVILNDTTHEIIEFSAKMPDREDFEESSVRGRELRTWAIVITLASIPFQIVGAMILLDKWIDKRIEKNKDKRCEKES